MDNREIQAIEACQKGELREFTVLYDLYLDKIYRFLYYRLKNKEMAEDLTSQTFIKAIEAIGTFRDKNGSFSAWLYRIARNNLIDELRKTKRHDDIEEHYEISSGENIGENIAAKLSLEEVEKYLNQLPAEQKDIIIMRVWDELSYNEISQIINKTPENCKVIFSRTISKLRTNMPLALFLALMIKIYE